MRQKREQFRARLDRVGQLRRGSQVVQCNLLEITEKGVLLSAELAVAVGERLELEFDLTAACPIRCTIFVVHVAHPHLGGLIASISPEHQQHISHFIEQMMTINLTGF